VLVVPRLRQRLRQAPAGCGRPFWADDPAFDLRHQVRQLACPPPGDERALLGAAATVIGEPYPDSRDIVLPGQGHSAAAKVRCGRPSAVRLALARKLGCWELIVMCGLWR
jgi:hypothetical protein